MSSRVVLTPRPNSHPFQERTVSLDQPLKIGRSVARSRPAGNNAIFDCKVLSRNHALLWYDGGKFYLQDSKSSNGTFVNNVRLSKSSEESPPTPISSGEKNVSFKNSCPPDVPFKLRRQIRFEFPGDILQFGVDVMEVTKKVTHGCIVASVQLFTPDGKEAKAVHPADTTPATTLQDMYALFQYLREAAEREEKLETKLAGLQKILRNTAEGVSSGWKILIEEDRFLARIDTLERQLLACHKTMNKDKLRDEVIQLNSDREKYQETAKEALRKSLSEKMEAIKKCQELERSLCAKDEDNRLLTERTSLISQELEQLASKFVESERKCESINEQFQESAIKHQSEVEELSQLLKENESHLVRDRFLPLPSSTSEVPQKQSNFTTSNHNDDVTLKIGRNDSASIGSASDLQDATVSSVPNEPQEPKVLRLSTTTVSSAESDMKTELTKLRERLGVAEEEKKGIVARLTYLMTVFEDLKSVSNKSGVSDYFKETIGKLDVELRQVKNFTLGHEEPFHNNYTIETVPQPNFLITQDLPHKNESAEDGIRDDLIKDDNDNGLKKLLEESREMVHILKRENLNLATELQAVKQEREKLRGLLVNLDQQNLEMSVASGKNAELMTEVCSLKDFAAAAQIEIRTLETKLQMSETKVKSHKEALDAAESDNIYLRRVISEQSVRSQEWEKQVQECKILHNGDSLSVSDPNDKYKIDLKLKMQEMEEELATFKDRYASSATECSRLSQKLQEKEAQRGPFYTETGFLLFIFVFISIVLAILIAFSPR